MKLIIKRNSIVISTFSILIILQFNYISNVRGESEDNKEEIVIVDETKINVNAARLFAIGDIDGDKESEVITFKSIVLDPQVQWIINTYHIDGEIWSPVLTEVIIKDVVGHIIKVDIGNFDTDEAQEIIIASWEGNSSKILLLDFNAKTKEFEIELIYRLNSTISDLEVYNVDKEDFDTIYVMFSDHTDSVEDFTTNLISINKDNEESYYSEVIYSEARIYWRSFTIGQFFKQNFYKNQILLYQYKRDASNTSNAIASIITTDGRLILDNLAIGMYSNIRDIVAWDRNLDNIDELCILDVCNCGDDIGFTNTITYCLFNQDGILKKENSLIDSNKIFNQICIGKLGDQNEKLFVLDPYLGSLTYARVFDEEARSFYDFWGYGTADLAFANFELIYELDLDIYVSPSGDFDYHSSGSTSSNLLYDFYSKVSPASCGADIAISVSGDAYSDWEVMGRAYMPGTHCIILVHHFNILWHIISHEVGHNYGLGHCSNPFCVMASAWHPLISDFCDDCENSIDKDKFGPPPSSGGGGCPILYTYDGTRYIEEGLLDIHDINGIDKTYVHILQNTPHQVKDKIFLQLKEHNKTISHIDHLRLYGRLENGEWVLLELKSAIHSSLGDVKNLLEYSDDIKVTEIGADINGGISETIDLEFHIQNRMNYIEFFFLIEGNNVIIK